LDGCVDAVFVVDGSVGEVVGRETAADPDHIFVAGVTDDGFGDAAEGEEGGAVALGNPGALVDLPGKTDEVVVEGGDDLVFILRVVVEHGEVLEIDGDEHGGGLELGGLLLEELLERVAGKGHVFEASVEFVEEDDVDGRAGGEAVEVGGGVDDEIGRRGVGAGLDEVEHGLGFTGLFDVEVIALEVGDDVAFDVGDYGIEDDDAGGAADGVGAVGVLGGLGAGRGGLCGGWCGSAVLRGRGLGGGGAGLLGRCGGWLLRRCG